MKRRKPSKADLMSLQTAYKAFQATATARAMAWHDFGPNGTQAELDAIVKADADALKPVQVAWIKATSYVNSKDRWTLVGEGMVFAMLKEANLWDEPLDVTSTAWNATHPL